MDADGFLCDLIATVARHGSTLEDVLAQFYKHSGHVRVEEIRNGEFDYLVYFENGDIIGYPVNTVLTIINTFIRIQNL